MDGFFFGETTHLSVGWAIEVADRDTGRGGGTAGGRGCHRDGGHRRRDGGRHSGSIIEAVQGIRHCDQGVDDFGGLGGVAAQTEAVAIDAEQRGGRYV